MNALQLLTDVATEGTEVVEESFDLIAKLNENSGTVAAIGFLAVVVTIIAVALIKNRKKRR